MDRERIQNQVKKKAIRRTKSAAKRTVKKKAKGLHPLSVVIWILSLAIGICLGIGAFSLLCQNDGFALRGSEVLTVSVGDTPVEFNDKGVYAVSFGQDISDKVKVSTDLRRIAPGRYEIDTTRAGEYYLIYTVEDVRFGDVRRVRTIVVQEGE